MKMRIARLLAVLSIQSLATIAFAQTAAKLSLERDNAALQLSWRGSFSHPDGASVRPFFELQRSIDLRDWRPFGERLRAPVTAPDSLLSVTPPASEPVGFFRLLLIEPRAVAKLGFGGAEVFGYGEAFKTELQRIGQISPDQFAAMFPSGANY